jgi:hypothetical protein
MANSGYEGLSDAVGGCLKIVIFAIIAPLVVWAIGSGIYGAVQSYRTSDGSTIQRGSEICSSHGLVAGETHIGVSVIPGEASHGRSFVECKTSEEGVRVFFEFDTVWKQ